MSALEFLPEALGELSEIGAYFESKQPNLGARFRDEVAEVCGAVLQHPLLWREREGSYRRVNFPVFPYYLAYFVRGERIIIAAIAHASRHPDFWKSRFP